MHFKTLLKEFIQNYKPHEVLDYCFYQYDLQAIAVEQLKIEREKNLRGSELIWAILEYCGYPPQVVPIGLYQIRQHINPTLRKAKYSYSQPQDTLDGLGVTIGKSIEKLLRELFRFYLGVLRRENINNMGLNNKEIEELCERYRNGGKFIGNYIGFKRNPNDECGYLTKLIYIVKNDEKLKDYCQKHFQCDEILTLSQIAEIGMCVVYRNIFSHDESELWNSTKYKGDKNLSKMDNKACENWEGNWNNLINEVETRSVPSDRTKCEMLQKMVVFYERFLQILSEKQIYPKVIVMISASIDEYKNEKISADSSNPEDPTFFITDCKYTPLTQFFYKQGIDEVGIRQILAPKSFLELTEWATKSNIEIEQENQEEA